MFWLRITACFSITFTVVLNQQIWDVVKQNEFVRIVDYCPNFPGCKIGMHVQCNRNPNMASANENDPSCGILAKEFQQEMTPAIADRLLAAFNAIRSKIALGKEDLPQLRRGYSMYRLQWDPELATHSQTWTRQCESNNVKTNVTALCFATKKFPLPGLLWGFSKITDLSNSTSFYGQHTLLKSRIISSLFTIVKDWYLLKHTTPTGLHAEDADDWWSSTKYLTMVIGHATHVGCGFSVHRELPMIYNYSAFKYDDDHRLRHVYIVEMACNFSERNKPYAVPYIQKKPTNPGFSKDCGCPLNTFEGPDCLCSLPNSNACLDSTCHNHMVILPIITVEDVVYNPKQAKSERRSRIIPHSEQQMQALLDLEFSQFKRFARGREGNIRDSSYWSPMKRRQGYNSTYHRNQLNKLYSEQQPRFPFKQSDVPVRESSTKVQQSDATILKFPRQSAATVQQSIATLKQSVEPRKQSDVTGQPADPTFQQSDVTLQQSEMPEENSSATIHLLLETGQQSVEPRRQSNATIKQPISTAQTLVYPREKSDDTIQQSILTAQQSLVPKDQLDASIQQSMSTLKQSVTHIQQIANSASQSKSVRSELSEKDKAEEVEKEQSKQNNPELTRYQGKLSNSLALPSISPEKVIKANTSHLNSGDNAYEEKIKVTTNETDNNKLLKNNNTDIDIDFLHLLGPFSKNDSQEEENPSPLNNILLHKIRPLILTPHRYYDSNEVINDKLHSAKESAGENNKINDAINKLLDFRYAFEQPGVTRSHLNFTFYTTEKSMMNVALRDNVPLVNKYRTKHQFAHKEDTLEVRHEMRTLSEEEFLSQERRYRQKLRDLNHYHKKQRGHQKSPHLRRTLFGLHAIDTDPKKFQRITPIERKLEENIWDPIFMRESTRFLPPG